MRVRLRSLVGARVIAVAGVTLLAAGLLPSMLRQHAGVPVASAQVNPTGTPTARAGAAGQTVQGPGSATIVQTPMAAASPSTVRGAPGPIVAVPETNAGVSGVVPAAAAAPAAQPLVPVSPVAAAPSAAAPPPVAVSGSPAVARPVAAQPVLRAAPGLPVVGSGGLLSADARDGRSIWIMDAIAVLLLGAGSFSYLHRRQRG